MPAKKLTLAEVFDHVESRTVLKKVPSGQIVSENGGDGVFLRFECSCDDALPFCKATCCSLYGTIVQPHEVEQFKELGLADTVQYDPATCTWIMARSSTGYCRQNDPETRRCKIYENRPATCQEFHCTQHASARGWQLHFIRQTL